MAAKKKAKKPTLDTLMKGGRQPKDSPEQPTWAWNWVGGGYNSARAWTKEEALVAADKIWPGHPVDIRTLHKSDEKELRRLDALYF